MAKKLLNENSVRRFMKLASLGALSSGFINEEFDEELEEGMYGAPGAREEEDPLAGPTVAEDMHTAAMGLEDVEGEELPLDDEPLEAAEEDDLPEGDREDLARRAIEAVAAALGIEIDISSDDADAEAGGLDLPPEEPLDDPLGDPLDEPPEELEEAAIQEEEELEEAAEVTNEEEDITESVMKLLNKADIEVVDDKELRENLVKKVAARVVKRLIKERA